MDFHISGELKRYNHLITETDRAYHEASLRLGLSDSAMIILYTICEDGQERCPLKELCRRSGLSKQTVNSALRKLEGEEILSLEKAGGKNKNVRLTEKGKALADNTALRIMEAENEIYLWTPFAFYLPHCHHACLYFHLRRGGRFFCVQFCGKNALCGSEFHHARADDPGLYRLHVRQRDIP